MSVRKLCEKILPENELKRITDNLVELIGSQVLLKTSTYYQRHFSFIGCLEPQIRDSGQPFLTGGRELRNGPTFQIRL